MTPPHVLPPPGKLVAHPDLLPQAACIPPSQQPSATQSPPHRPAFRRPRSPEGHSCRYLGVLQRWLVAGRTVEHPLQGICMDVAKEELLHQAVQVVQWVLLLHPDELQLMHGEVDSFGALTAVLFPPQVVGHILHPGTPREDEAGARAVHQLAELLGYCLRVAYDLHIVQLVVGLGAPTDDPGGLAQADLAPDDEGVRGAGAAVAAVVELVGLEGVVVVESVGPCEELWAWPHLTAEEEKGRGTFKIPKALRRDSLVLRNKSNNESVVLSLCQFKMVDFLSASVLWTSSTAAGARCLLS